MESYVATHQLLHTNDTMANDARTHTVHTNYGGKIACTIDTKL